MNIHENTQLFKDKLQKDQEGKILKVCGFKYDGKKSLVGTVGQLEMSGKSNAVCISQSSYLTPEKIMDDVTCKEITEFILQVIVP